MTRSRRIHENEATVATPSATVFEQLPDDVRLLTKAFEEAIYASHQFSWIGLVRALDHFGRLHFVLYLVRGPVVRNGNEPVDVMQGYRKLALAMMSHRSYIDLYFLDADGLANGELVDIVKREAAAQYAEWTILRAEPISPSSRLVRHSA